MGKFLKQPYEKDEEVTSSNEYKFLARMYTEIYAENTCLKSKIRTLITENLKLSNQIFKLRKEIKK